MADTRTVLRQSLGPFAPLLDAKDVIELSANQDGRVFVERSGRPPELAGELTARAREQIVRLCASEARVEVTAAKPIVSTKIGGYGYRFEGLMPPAVEAPAFSIRFHNAVVRPLDAYVEDGTMNRVQAEILRDAIATRQNILVSGGTSSGKTTLLNSLLQVVETSAPEDRLVVLEDTPELKTQLPNVVMLRATEAADMTRLLASTLRLRPDRIIVGEVRDGAALALLKAWNTGHPGGLASLHANSAEDALTRLDLLVREASAQPLPAVIGSAVDLVVSIARTRAGRRVQEIIKVKGYANDQFECEKLS